MKPSNLIGQRFNKLVVFKRVDNNKYGQTVWLCQCDCGNEKEILGLSLTKGRTTSCGCLAKELIGNRARTHGTSKTRLWKIWCAMRSRCKTDNARVARYYKNRGITVCDEWLVFENFQRDMEQSYNEHVVLHGEKRTSIDRIDSDLGYYKDNCRWATPDVQSKNQRSHYVVNSYEKISEFLKEVSSLNNIDIKLTEKQFNKICEKLR